MKNIVSGFELQKFNEVKENSFSAKTHMLNEFIKDDKIYLPIKDIGGIYFFWWTGNIDFFMNSAIKCYYNLKGKRSLSELVKVEFSADWIEKSTFDNKICLYIGKSTNIKGRVSKHLKLQTKDIWRNYNKNNGSKPNSESQLRIGIERIFDKHLSDGLIDNISISWFDLSGYNNGINRFYLENYLIGKYFPLFNIDIER